jgi:N-acetylglucosamine kinase-like BadF-type ATPase
LAGAGHEKIREQFERWAVGRGIAQPLLVVPDIELVFAAAAGSSFPPGRANETPCIALVAGTGSIASGRDASGRGHRVGGWGFRLGDDGSGFAIGLAGLRAALRAVEQREPATALAEQLAETLRLPSPQHLLPWAQEAISQPAEIANLASCIFSACDHDRVAREIVEAAAKELADMVVAVATQLAVRSSDFVLAVAGGLLVHRPEYRALVESQLARTFTQPRQVVVISDPVVGALGLAARAARTGSG